MNSLYTDGEKKPVFYTVKPKKGGHNGDHGAYKKIKQTFTHVRFQHVREAKDVLKKVAAWNAGSDRPTDIRLNGGRKIVASPAVRYKGWIPKNVAAPVQPEVAAPVQPEVAAPVQPEVATTCLIIDLTQE